jgi:hypothetical protein
MGMVTFVKLAVVLGFAAFGAGAIGVAGTTVMAVGAVVLLVAAVAGAVVLEERDSVEGLVVHDLTITDGPPAETVPEEALAA